MLYDVVLLRKHGERLSKKDLPSFMRGSIRITEMDRQYNHFKRNIVHIHLWESHGQTNMRGLATMADPVLLPYNGAGLVIAGIEVEVCGDTIKEHRQVWMCKPAAGTEAEWAREKWQRRQLERKKDE